MTYAIDVEEVGCCDSKLPMGDRNGDYVALPVSGELGPGGRLGRGGCFWWWAKIVLLSLFASVAAVAFILWGGPFLIEKVVIPILDWEAATFSTPMLGFILFSSIGLFPALLLPSAPSMWLAGMTFGYVYGFLLIMAGMSIGMSMPYFIGSLFRVRIHRWLERWPKKAAIIRLAGEGDWFHQFRAVTLIRVSPFPYIIFNYSAVATNVSYGPYICGSLVGTIPETFITIYSGILIRSLADATNGHRFLSVQQIIYNTIGFCTALAATIAITVYAKRALRNLQFEEELQ